MCRRVCVPIVAASGMGFRMGVIVSVVVLLIGCMLRRGF
jgi:hypothetical protein